MRKPICRLGLLALLSMALLSGCGGYDTTAAGYPAPSAAAQLSAVSLSITDAPPAGMAVLSFQVTLNSAVLSPGNVDLLTGQGPIRLEVTRLATEIAALNTVNVTPGTFTSLTLTFADPEITFKNNTGAVLLGCPIGDVCELNSSNLPGPLVSAITFASPGLVVSASSPFGLLVDLHLSTLLTNQAGLPGVDFSQSGAATVQRVILPNVPTGTVQRVDNLQGIVLAKDAANNRFTLQTVFRGRVDVRVSDATRYRDFDGCAAANFTCVQQDQIVEVELGLLAGGVLHARAVELEERLIPRADHALDGIIYQIDSLTQFRMVLTDLRRDIGLAVFLRGRRVTVQLQTDVQFEVDAHGIPVPPTLRSAFENATDTSQLRVGQHVQIRRISLSTGPPIVIGTNRVRLHRSVFTATVATTPVPSGTNVLFDLNALSGLFTGTGITLIHAQVFQDTEFEGVNSPYNDFPSLFPDLGAGLQVSLRGLIFADASPAALNLVADKVRARTQ